MKNQSSFVGLAALNLIVLFCIAAQPKEAPQDGVHAIVRARAIELVDDQGRVRASLNVATNGEAVFRMRDEKEVIRLKIGASEKGSALLLLDATTNPGLHVLARDRTTMTLQNADGRKRVVEP